MLEQLDVLEGAGYAQLGDPVGPHAEDAFALPANVSLLRLVEAAEAVEDRSLAGTVGPNDGEELTVPHEEAHVVDCLKAGKGQRDVIDFEQRTVVFGPIRLRGGGFDLVHDSHRLRRL